MKVTAVETISAPSGPSPALSFLRLHTDSGLCGLGETYYTPESVASYVHEVLAPQVLGRDIVVENVWDDLYAQSARRVGGGTDMRALSAMDLAIWDLRGKALAVPVFTLLGGAHGWGVRVYNTCAGGRYATAGRVGTGTAETRDDLWRATHEPGELAKELRDQGFVGMKVWPFDASARIDGGRLIDSAALRSGIRVFEEIRSAVGDRLEIMLEGHGLWQPSAAARILSALQEHNVLWAEDMVLAHDPRALRWLADRSAVPLAASEYLAGRWEYRRLLETGAIHFLHLDPSWCGGITEAQRIIAVASAFGVTCAMHDCTGPINLLAGLHLAEANSSVAYQEVLRSFLRDVYPGMVTTQWRLENGRLAAPTGPGLGAELTESFLNQPSLAIRSSSSRA